MKPAVIFDLDGTLLYTDELIRESFIRVFAKMMPDYTLSEEEILSFLGPSLRKTFSKYLPENKVDEAIQCYQEYNLTHHEDFVYPYPTVMDTLQYLKREGYPLAIVTTKMKESADVGIQLFHLDDYIDVVIGRDRVKHEKPDPEGILKAMELLKVNKAYYIGDNTTDIEAGKRAGVKTIGVKWSPKGYDAMAKLNPDLLIDQMKEIIPYIEEDEQC